MAELEQAREQRAQRECRLLETMIAARRRQLGQLRTRAASLRAENAQLRDGVMAAEDRHLGGATALLVRYSKFQVCRETHQKKKAWSHVLGHGRKNQQHK